MKAKFGQQQLKGRVTVTDRTRIDRDEVWVVDISTVDFPNLPAGRSLPPETCLFWSNARGHSGTRKSSVVETYTSWEAAVDGHMRWVNSPKAVAEAMVEAGWRG